MRHRPAGEERTGDFAPYGSYVFLGTILTDQALDLPPRTRSSACVGCGKCLAACPGGALGENGVDLSRCLSELTQKKGDLTGEEAALVKAHPLIWGCDTCQRVCPYNTHPALSPLPEFREDLVDALDRADLEGLTNRTFRDKYGDRAFAWRGPAPCGGIWSGSDPGRRVFLETLVLWDGFW